MSRSIPISVIIIVIVMGSILVIITSVITRCSSVGVVIHTSSSILTLHQSFNLSKSISGMITSIIGISYY